MPSPAVTQVNDSVLAPTQLSPELRLACQRTTQSVFKCQKTGCGFFKCLQICPVLWIDEVWDGDRVRVVTVSRNELLLKCPCVLWFVPVLMFELHLAEWLTEFDARRLFTFICWRQQVSQHSEAGDSSYACGRGKYLHIYRFCIFQRVVLIILNLVTELHYYSHGHVKKDILEQCVEQTVSFTQRVWTMGGFWWWLTMQQRIPEGAALQGQAGQPRGVVLPHTQPQVLSALQSPRVPFLQLRTPTHDITSHG